MSKLLNELEGRWKQMFTALAAEDLAAEARFREAAAASEARVLKLWEGLGYYSRARNMHVAAQYVSLELHGHFPSNFDSLLKMKGVGRYTAAAIASLSLGLPACTANAKAASNNEAEAPSACAHCAPVAAS